MNGYDDTPTVAETDKVHFEIFIAMNENGDVEFGHSAEEARETLLENYESNTIRSVVLLAKMTPPALEAGPEVEIPDNARETVEVTSSD
jgi:hypothetical protein